MLKGLAITVAGLALAAGVFGGIYVVKPSIIYLNMAKAQLSLTTGIDRQAEYTKLRQSAYEMRGLFIFAGSDCELQTQMLVTMFTATDEPGNKHIDLSEMGSRISIVRNITIGTCLELQGK